MLTALIAVHCMGAGGTLVYMALSNLFTSALGSSRGIFSMPEVLLCSAGWEIYWGLALLSVAKDKYRRANARR